MKKVFLFAALVLACTAGSNASAMNEAALNASNSELMPVKKSTKKTTKKSTKKTTKKLLPRRRQLRNLLLLRLQHLQLLLLLLLLHLQQPLLPLIILLLPSIRQQP